jgi:Fe-S-cluster containining protein
MTAELPIADTAKVRVEAQIGSCQLKLSATLPTGPTRLDDLMPLLQILSDNVVAAAEREAEQRGACISCTKGCGACCRQLVPVSPVEARHVARLVAEMPEPRRSEVVSRFQAARAKLEESGLWQQLLDRHAWRDDSVSSVGLAYFRQGIPCPFLEDESCSIHRERPMTCREYLVTSPAVNCANPTPEGIEWLPLDAKVWVAAARTEGPASANSRFVNWVPLIQALDWAAENSEAPPTKNGPDLLRDVLENLANSGNTTIGASAEAVSSQARNGTL